MGSGCSRDPNNTSTVIDPTSSYHNQINEELAPFLSLDSPYNINHKFTYLFEIIREETSGTGIHKGYAYKSKIPLEEIQVKRAEYWETRTEGLTNSWNALRSACEASQADAIKILNAAGIKLVNRSLQLAFDLQGNKYDVPVFCLNDPVKYEIPEKKRLRKEDLKGEAINVKFRTAGAATDVKMQIMDNWSIPETKKAYVKSVNEPGLTADGVRLFFGGKEMVNSGLVAEYSVMNDLVIQVFKRKPAQKGI